MGNSSHALQSALSRLGTYRHIPSSVPSNVHTQDIRAIAFSPGDQFLTIGGGDGKITIKNPKDVLPSSDFTTSVVDGTIESVSD